MLAGKGGAHFDYAEQKSKHNTFVFAPVFHELK